MSDDAGAVNGFVAPGFERVGEMLGAGATLTLGERERRADLGEGGGAFSAFVDGECVVDIWTGVAGPDGRAWEEDTRAVIMSSTKGLTALCAHILEDRGELDLDAPVARYWPEFGQAGKSATTVRQLLSHQSGAIGRARRRQVAVGGTGAAGTTREAIAAAIAGGEPAWEPGTRHGYHGVTFGWLVGELVRRISGQSLGAFFEAEVAGRWAWPAPSGRRRPSSASVATVMEFPVKPGTQSALRAIDPDSKSGRAGPGRRPRQPVRRRAGRAPLRRLHEHARPSWPPRSAHWGPPRRPGRWPGSTWHWRTARSW